MSSTITIRTATERDIDSCLQLFQEANFFHGDTPYFPKEFLAAHQESDFFWVAETEEKEVIAAIFGEEVKNNGILLWGLVVRKDWQGHGIGKLLIKHLEQEAKNKGKEWITLYALDEDVDLSPFYEKQGYERLCKCIVYEKNF